MLAVLYDVHGNLRALEGVLADAQAAGADEFLIGGDAVAFGPEPAATLERLRALPAATWIRGNTERWLIETPAEGSGVWRGLHETRARLTWEDVELLYALPTRHERGDALFVHASPLSDCDTFASEPASEDARRLAGVADCTVVFGHSHVQFSAREGPNGTKLLNPGSVGQPLDGDPSAAYALFDEHFDLRRVEYDHRGAAQAMRAHGDWAEPFARRIELGSLL